MHQFPIDIYPIMLRISLTMVYLLNSYFYGSNIYRVKIQSLFKLTYSIDLYY